MNYYQPNPACRCGRCSTRGLMGPAILITTGLLFLLATMANYPFHRTWPILLIVIGGIKVLRYVVPDDQHVNPGFYPPAQYGGQYAAPYPPAGGGAVVTPPPEPRAGSLGAGSGENEVHNG